MRAAQGRSSWKPTGLAYVQQWASNAYDEYSAGKGFFEGLLTQSLFQERRPLPPGACGEEWREVRAQSASLQFIFSPALLKETVMIPKSGDNRWDKLMKLLLMCRQESGNSRSRDQSTVSESSRRFRTEFLEDWPQTPGAPYFDPSTPDNVTGLVGHPVSWVRHRDIHLLTVGRYTYTSDQRFEAQHKPRSEEWALYIRSPQRRDSGQYECQISTTPPIGHAVHLNIVEPETEIMGGSDLFIYAGSTINLTCIVRHTPEPPSTINWTHRGKRRVSTAVADCWCNLRERQTQAHMSVYQIMLKWLLPAFTCLLRVSTAVSARIRTVDAHYMITPPPCA
ncbi:unnamed protein product [Diatraea saccharalis]|uniref:Ig-like domain-containing protein n=1 Tax=Diatraea saccharalis TaxID=40085 RepID=A0A9N9WBY7_9NEOP|nr:unnamed protein product [Diatraea saccharalis]